MCEICRGNSLSRRAGGEEIKQLVHKILENYPIDKVILFGSIARGDTHEFSDIDMVVIGPFQERFVDRIGKILDLYEGDRSLDALVYTPEEFERMVRAGRQFAETVLEEGVVVYDRLKELKAA